MTLEQFHQVARELGAKEAPEVQRGKQRGVVDVVAGAAGGEK